MLKKLKLRLICWLSAELYKDLGAKYLKADAFAKTYGDTEAALLADAYAWQIVGLSKLRKGEKG